MAGPVRPAAPGGAHLWAASEAIWSASALDALSGEWAALAGDSRGYSFSQTAAYGRTAVEFALSQGAEVRLLHARQGARLVGVWPLIIRREGAIRIARPVSCGSYEEYTGPLVATSVEAEASAALLREAASQSCDVLTLMNVKTRTCLSQLLEQGGLARLPRRVRSVNGYGIRLSRFADWDDYRAQSSPSRAAALRRKLRRLERAGKLSFGWCRTAAEARLALDWAFAAKRDWARRRRLYAPWLESTAVQAFFVRLAEQVDLRDNPLFTFLKLDGRPLAVQINLIGGGAFESMFVARDEAFGKYSTGELLTEYCARLAIERRLDFDFRIMRDRYKESRSDVVDVYKSYRLYLTGAGRIAGALQGWLADLRAPAFRATGKVLRAGQALTGWARPG